MSSSPDSQSLSKRREELERELRDWWNQRNEEWGSGKDDGLVEDGGVWSHMPEIDSKEVTRAAPVCEKHLDIDFDPSMIREGGYGSIDDLIDHLVPKMIEEAQETLEQ
ncbi:hypothetical protein [Natrinema sp. H-ect4]|uniref:hypothetical protein n=1 Tax=Natrinema sp. H-ect4 TaxID=3242699 RepID=UPI0035A9798C